jgi:hypothetical protein
VQQGGDGQNFRVVRPTLEPCDCRSEEPRSHDVIEKARLAIFAPVVNRARDGGRVGHDYASEQTGYVATSCCLVKRSQKS